VVHHGRAVKYRLLEIARAAKSLTDASKQRMRDSYKKLAQVRHARAIQNFFDLNKDSKPCACNGGD